MKKIPKTPGTTPAKIGKDSFLYSKIFSIKFPQHDVILYYNSNFYNLSAAAKSFNPAPGEWSKDILGGPPKRSTPGRSPILEEVDFSQSDLYVHQRGRMLADPMSARRRVREPSPPRADISKYPKYLPREDEEAAPETSGKNCQKPENIYLPAHIFV